MAIDLRTDSPTGDGPRATRSMTQRSPSGPPAKSSGSTKWKRWLLLAPGLTLLGATAYLFSGAVQPADVEPKLTHTIARRDLKVTVTEQGTLESSDNTEVRCKVKGAANTIVWIIENGTEVKPDDVLVRIDTSTIEDNINTQEISYQNALATYAQSKSDVAVAEINITEYLQGTYQSELKTKQKDVAIAQANLRSAQNMLNHAQEMYRKGFMSKLELEGNEYSLQQAELELEVKETDLEVLTKYTRAKQIQDLEGILEAKKAKLASDQAALDLAKAKLDREKEQLENCVIRATTSGMVIYGGGERWEDRPDIREGATVREDQVLLLIPDLSNMQVKVGVHESLIGQVKPGLPARVELQDQTCDGEVLSIAPMAEPAGWWNGNMVKYETIIQLDTQARLKPGMSATVEIYLAEYNDVLTIPVAAVMEKDGQFFCWVRTENGLQQRPLELGDSDNQFLIVKDGVTQEEEVVLNPIAYIPEAQRKALKPFSGVKATDSVQPEKQEADAVAGGLDGKADADAAQGEAKLTGAMILQAADKNQDGVLTVDEFAEKDRARFDEADQNKDGQVDEAELDAGIKRLSEAKP